MSRRGAWIPLGVLAVAPSSPIRAQDLDARVAACRYEDAAASLQDASPEAARVGATASRNVGSPTPSPDAVANVEMLLEMSGRARARD